MTETVRIVALDSTNLILQIHEVELSFTKAGNLNAPASKALQEALGAAGSDGKVNIYRK